MPKFLARATMAKPGSTKDVHAQSMAVMRTTLHCCLSTVLYHRNILPNKSFKHQDVLLADTSKANMIMLFRGPSHRTDTLLGWLDEGALYALDMGMLAAVQIGIHPDARHRARVLETYTFSVQYADLDASAGTDPDRDGLIYGDAHGEQLRGTIEAIGEFCKKMPALPREKYLSMTLFLRPEAENKFQIENFDVAKRGIALFPRDDDWGRVTYTSEALSSDAHGARLRISYMTSPPGSKVDSQSGKALPDLRDYKHQVPVNEDLDWSFMNDKTGQLSKIMAAQNETQQNGIQMAKSLNGMLQNESYTQGDTQAATMSLAHRTQLKDEPKVYSFNLENMHHLKRPVEALQRQARDLHKTIGGVSRSGQVILCICGHSREEGDMVTCSMCGTWQHLHCCGYLGQDDPRRTKQHVCYLCYVDPRDQETLTALIEIALRRRAMYRALRYGISTKSEYADRLGISQTITATLFNDFRAKKFVIAASGSHKAGFKLLGKPPWVPIGGGEASYGTMLNEVYDPTTYLARYFEPYDHKPADFAKYLTVSKNAELPQAVVPASDRRKKTADDSSSIVKRERDDEDAKSVGRPRKKTKSEKLQAQRLYNLESTRIIDCIVDKGRKSAAAKPLP